MEGVVDPVTLMAVGTAVQMFGQFGANFAQAQQERINQKYYQDQANFVIQSHQRASQLAEYDYTQRVGAQLSAYGSSGVDISGSAAITIGGTYSQLMDELWALEKKKDLEWQLASMRGNVAGDKASLLTSNGYNVVQAGTIGLKGYTDYSKYQATLEAATPAPKPAPTGSGGK